MTAPEFPRATLEQWQKAAAKSAPGGDVAALNWVTPEGIVVKPLYTAADTAGLPMERVYTMTLETDTPMAFCRQVGKGRVVYFPMDIDRTFWEVLAPDHLLLLKNAVAWAMEEKQPMTVTGPGLLDLSYWRQARSITAHLVNMTNPMMMKGPYREVMPLAGPFTVSLALPDGVKPGTVRLLESGAAAKHRMEGGRLVVEVPKIRLHEVVAIDLA